MPHDPIDHRAWIMDRSQWRLFRCWWPRRCEFSGQQLWLKRAYRGRTVITGPGDPVVLDRWLSIDQFVIWRLTKK